MSTPDYLSAQADATVSPPLQYLKRIRLDQAKRLMAHEGYNAGTAARAVG